MTLLSRRHGGLLVDPLGQTMLPRQQSIKESYDNVRSRSSI